MNGRMHVIPGSELCPVMVRAVNLSELKLPLTAAEVTSRCIRDGAKALQDRVSEADRKRARGADPLQSPALKRAASSLSLASLQTASSEHGVGLTDLLHFGATAR